MPGLGPYRSPLSLCIPLSGESPEPPCVDPPPSFLPWNGGTTDEHREAGGWANLGDRWQTFVVRAHIAAM